MSEGGGHSESLRSRSEIHQSVRQFQDVIADSLLTPSPSSIARWSAEDIHQQKQQISMIPGVVGEIGSVVFDRYRAREKAIQKVWDENDLDEPTLAIKQQLLTVANRGKEVSLSDDVLEQLQIQRIHGGIALSVSPEVLQSVLSLTIHKGDGTTITDSQEILEELKQYTEFGFLLDHNELGKDGDLGLPTGTRIALVHNTDPFHVARVIRHEEKGEMVGMYIDEARAEGEVTDRYRNVAHTTPEVAEALYDLAARIEDGSTENGNYAISLAEIGITPDFAGKNKKQQVLAQEVYLISQRMQEELNDTTLSPEAQRERAQVLARDIRGAILAPKNLLRGEEEESKHVNKHIQEVQLRTQDFYGTTQDKVTFHTEKNGRFVWNKGTLEPRVAGRDTIVNKNIVYQVTDIISNNTGQGIIYKAQERVTNAGFVPETVAIKELIFEAPEALIASKHTAYALVDGLIDDLVRTRKLDPTNPDRDVVRDALHTLVGNEKFGQAFMASLIDGALTTEEGDPLWQGGRLLSFNSKTGQAITSLTVLAALRRAVGEFATTTTATKYRNYLSEAKQMFLEENETLFALQDIPGISGSLGITFGDPQQFNPGSDRYNNMYLILRYADGKTLEKEVFETTSTPWNYQRTITFMNQFLETLQAVHTKNIIHKDIKPANIIVDSKTGKPFLIDFGIAIGNKHVRQGAKMKGATAPAGIYFTEPYSAPEQFFGNSDFQSDIYSTGMILFGLLTGRDPEDVFDTIGRDAQAKYTEASDIFKQEIARLPSGSQREVLLTYLSQVTLKAMHPDHQYRYKTADEMRQALSEVAIQIPMLDEEFKKLDKRYPPGTVDIKNMRIPVEVSTYINTIEQRATDHPHLISDSVQRLEQFATYVWQDTALQSFSGLLASRSINRIMNNAVHKDIPIQPQWLHTWSQLYENVMHTQARNSEFLDNIPSARRTKAFTDYVQTMVSIANAPGGDKGMVISSLLPRGTLMNELTAATTEVYNTQNLEFRKVKCALRVQTLATLMDEQFKKASQYHDTWLDGLYTAIQLDATINDPPNVEAMKIYLQLVKSLGQHSSLTHQMRLRLMDLFQNRQLLNKYPSLNMSPYIL